MNSALAPYLFTLYISVSVCWFMAFYTWRRRPIAGAVPFAIAFFAAGFWAFCYGMELITPALSAKLIWFNLKQLGASVLGPAILISALSFTGKKLQFPRIIYPLLSLEPIATQMIFWSNSTHGLAGTPALVTDQFLFPVLHFEFGPWYWFSIFIGYLLLTMALFILLAQLTEANQLYRKQIVLILMGLLPPWLLGSVALFDVGKLAYLDATTFVFPVSVFFIGVGLFRYQMFQLTPVAYSAVFASIRDGIIIVDDDFHILEVNPATLHLLGLHERSLIGHSLSAIFPEANIANLKAAPFNQNLTLEIFYENGEQSRHLELHSGAIVSNIYNASGHVLILYDVTGRKLAEKASQLSEDRYRTIFETDSAATIIMEADMTISLANDRFSVLSGYARQEIEGKKKWPEFVHQDNLPEMEAYHKARRTLAEDVPNEYEFRFVDRYGRIKDVYISVALVPDSTISIGSMLDITDRKLAEQLLEQRASALEVAVRGEQERSAIILQSVNDAIAVSDLAYKAVYVNQAFVNLTGYSQDEMLGRGTGFILDGRIPPQTWHSLQEAIINQTVWEGELPFRRKNGVAYDAAVLIAPMRDGYGQLVGYVSSHRDITEAKRQEESRRRFVTNISHELRTPLTNIKLYTDLLKRNIHTTRGEQYFSTLDGQIARLENIIQSSLEIVSLEDSQDHLRREPIYWGALSQNLYIQLHPQAVAKNISLQFSPELDQLPSIIGDPQRISQALYELIHNAIAFTMPGGQVSIMGQIQTESATKWLMLSVQDNGPGIDPSEQERIFDRFYRGKQTETGHIPGTGLGLSMVTLIVQAHNGRLTLKSQPGQGSTFTLWFPLN